MKYLFTRIRREKQKYIIICTQKDWKMTRKHEINLLQATNFMEISLWLGKFSSPIKHSSIISSKIFKSNFRKREGYLKLRARMRRSFQLSQRSQRIKRKALRRRRKRRKPRTSRKRLLFITLPTYQFLRKCSTCPWILMSLPIAFANKCHTVKW